MFGSAPEGSITYHLEIVTKPTLTTKTEGTLNGEEPNMGGVAADISDQMADDNEGCIDGDLANKGSVSLGRGQRSGNLCTNKCGR